MCVYFGILPRVINDDSWNYIQICLPVCLRCVVPLDIRVCFYVSFVEFFIFPRFVGKYDRVIRFLNFFLETRECDSFDLNVFFGLKIRLENSCVWFSFFKFLPPR